MDAALNHKLQNLLVDELKRWHESGFKCAVYLPTYLQPLRWNITEENHNTAGGHYAYKLEFKRFGDRSVIWMVQQVDNGTHYDIHGHLDDGSSRAMVKFTLEDTTTLKREQAGFGTW